MVTPGVVLDNDFVLDILRSICHRSNTPYTIDVHKLSPLR